MTEFPHDATHALLLFAHGSADPGWAMPFERLKQVLCEREPERVVALAYLERMTPSFEAAVSALQAKGVTHITVAPIFLAIGGHMRKDLPALISETQQRTGIEFRVLPALGEVDMLIESIAAWVLSVSR